MRNIKELYHRLTEQTDFDKKYPNLNVDDKKIHLLFVSPCLNSSGYYRAIIPTLELNRTDSHVAIITNIHKWSFNQQLIDYVTPIDNQLILWADYIILPTLLENATYLIKAWKAQNKDLQFVMDLDCNLHALPKQHLDYPRISLQHKKQLLSNVSQMDILTGANDGLLDYYDDMIEEYYPDSGVQMEYLPNLVSQFGYQELDPLVKNETDTIRIGIVSTGASHYDVVSIYGVLKEIVEDQERVELIVFGWNGKLPGDINALSNLKFTYQKSVRFLNYFQQLNELALDIALIPTKKIAFNTHGKSFAKYLEFSVFAIPVVASDHEPFREIIEDGETGFLVKSPEEWKETIGKLIEDPELRVKIGKSALKHVWRNYSYTNHTLKAYQELFI